jgi:hypothetical protein
MLVIPNERRTLNDSLEVTRLHDEMARLVKLEYEASIKYIRQKTLEGLAKQAKGEHYDMPI